MSNTDYNILFGQKDDDRVNLFIHTVETMQRINKVTVYDLFTKTNPVFVGKVEENEFVQNGFFGDDEIRGKLESKRAIHPEWALIISDIILYIHSTSTDTNKSPEIINKIKELKATNVEKDKLGKNKLLVELVKALYTLKDARNDDISYINTSWDSLSSYTVNPDVLKNLFGDNLPKTIPITNKTQNKLIKNSVVDTYSDLGFDVKTQIETHGFHSGETISNFKLDKYIARMHKSRLVTNDSANFWISDGVSVQKYSRNNNGELVKNENGTEVVINEDTLINALKNKCDAAGVKGTSSQCTNYIIDCLQGNDFNKCKDYLNTKNILEFIPEEIKNMPPQLIQDTIAALKIRLITVTDPSLKITIKQPVSYNDWIKELRSQTGMTQTDIDAIRNHAALRKYIETLISYVISNPAILNEHYIKSSPGNRMSPHSFKGTFGYKIGLHPNYPSNYQYPTGLITISDIERLHLFILDEQRRMSNSLGFLQNTGMRGGSHYDFKESQENPLKQTNQIFKNYFIALKGMLDAQGKKIANEDEEKIVSYLQKLENSEQNLLKSFKYINEYNRLLNNFGEKDSVRSLTFGHLENFVNERNTKLQRFGNKQLSAISMLRAIVQGLN
jgi:hypothetical protein